MAPEQICCLCFLDTLYIYIIQPFKRVKSSTRSNACIKQTLRSIFYKPLDGVLPWIACWPTIFSNLLIFWHFYAEVLIWSRYQNYIVKGTVDVFSSDLPFKNLDLRFTTNYPWNSSWRTMSELSSFFFLK